MSSPLPVLCIGLKSPGPQSTSENGKVDARIDPAKGHLEREVERATAQNLSLEFLLVDLDQKAVDECVTELKHRLDEKRYAAISIGFGVRGNRDHTDVFEKLVNTCVELNPGVKFGFAIWPDDVVASLERALGRS